MSDSFIDLEGAFDTVWRASTIYKLHQAGLTGQLLCYIDSYLRDRLVHNQVNDYISDWFSTLLGVPQGSVIAPLFVCWIHDMSINIGQHIGYDDDLTNLITTVNLSEASEEMGRNLVKMSVWCQRWKATINFPKTDYIVHSLQGNQQVAVDMSNTPLVQVDVKKCLGVILDEALTFKPDIDHIVTVALSTLNKVGTVFHGTSVETFLHIYAAIVCPHVERTYPIWCCGRVAIRKLETVQRQALLHISGVFISTSNSDLEILMHTMLLWMCLDEVLLHEYSRICHRPSDDFLRLLVCDLLGNTLHLNHRVLSPIHILKSAMRQGDFDKDLFQRVEPAPVMLLSRLKSDIPAIHWGPENLGSSKTQTTTQAAATRAHTQSTLEDIPIGQPIIFTDGSALSIPGPCEAAAVCFPEGLISEPVVCDLSVSKCSTSYHGELCAIRLATTFSVSYSDTHLTRQIHIFSDCKSALASSASLDLHICH